MLVTGVVFAIAQMIPRPVLFPDESATLASARFFTGLGGPSEWWFQPGYGLVVAPALLVTQDLESVMLWVHGVNAVLAGLTALALIRIDRRIVPDRAPLVRPASAFIVGIYPAYVYFAGQAIADNLLTTAVVFSVLSLVVLRQNGSKSTWILASAAVCSLMVVHARWLPIVLSWALVIVWHHGAFDRRRLPAGAALMAGAVGFYLTGRALIDYDRQSALSELTRQGLGDLIGDLLNLRALMVLPFTVLGTLMYLLMATLGLLVLGGIAAWQHFRSDDGERVAVAQFSICAMATTALLSGVFTNQGQGDLAMYGRYVEVVAAIPIFWSLAWLLEQPLPSWFRSRLIPGLILLACVVVGIRGYDAFEGRNQLLNVSGTAAVSRIVGEIDPLAYALLIAGVMFVLSVARQRVAGASAVVIVAFFGANLYVLYDNAIDFAERADRRLELLDELAVVDPSECVALDQSDLTDFFTQESYRVNDLERDYLFWSSESGEQPPCDSFVISESSSLGNVLVGWRPVAVEQDRRAWLWVSPDVDGQVAVRVIRPLPGQPLFEPTADVSIDVTVGAIRTGEAAPVVVEFTNTSTQTYVPIRNVPSGIGGVQVGLEWRDPDQPDERLHEPVRVAVPGLVRPGDTVVVEGVLPVNIAGAPGREGVWLVRAELVQESVEWFGVDGGASTPLAIFRDPQS